MSKIVRQCHIEELNYYKKIPLKRLIKRRIKKYKNIGQQFLING